MALERGGGEGDGGAAFAVAAGWQRRGGLPGSYYVARCYADFTAPGQLLCCWFFARAAVMVAGVFSGCWVLVPVLDKY